MPSSIESQQLPHVPACSCKFHALTVYLHPTFTVPFQSEVHLESNYTSVARFFAEIVDVFRSLGSFTSLGLHKEILDSPCLLLLLIYTKRKTEIRNLGLTLYAHFSSLKLSKCFQIPHPSPNSAYSFEVILFCSFWKWSFLQRCFHVDQHCGTRR